MVAVLASVMLLGCSDSRPTTTPGASSSAAAVAVQLPTTIDDVLLEPPPPDVHPDFSEADARAVVTAHHDLDGASRIDSVLAVVTEETTDHVLAWVFVGYDVPFPSFGGGGTLIGTVVEPVGIESRQRLFFRAHSGTSS